MSSIALTQPHAAYAAFTHGLKHRLTYLIRTIPDIESLLQPLEDAIRHKFLPSLTGQTALSNDTRDILALPVQHGGLGIINPTRNSRFYHQSSKHITAPLISLISEQSHIYQQDAKAQQLTAKKEAIRQRKERDSAAAAEMEVKLTNDMHEESNASLNRKGSLQLAWHPPYS